MMRSGPWVYRGVLLLITLLLLEALSWVVLTRVMPESNLIRRDLDRLPESATLQKMQDARDLGYDPHLGWVTKPGRVGSAVDDEGGSWSFSIDETGARANPYPGDRVQISVYGDSYAFCGEVDDDETWPFFLSRLTDTRVLNFGVPAYGTDQALWRLQTMLPEHPTRIVVLSVLSENIGRLLMTYRPFYFSTTRAMVGFKPVLELHDGEWRKGPNPLPRAESLEDFRRALDISRSTDFWYLRNAAKPRAAFPYLLSLIRIAAFRLSEYEELDLYDRPDATGRLRAVIHQFGEHARDHGFVPITLFIPAHGALRVSSRGREPSYRAFVRDLRQDPRLDGMEIIDLLDYPFDPHRFNNKPFAGHASVYGNEVIARIMFDVVRDRLDQAGSM